MMDDGLIESQLLASDRGKQVYQLTDKGFEELKKWMYQKPETESSRLEILLKRYFAGVVDPGIMIHHIETFQLQHKQELLLLNQFKNELESIDDPHHNHSDILSVIDFGIKTNTAYLEWSKETIQKLAKKHT
jgi:PadR family transcriptional regulator, regulatory protein AphA